MTCGPAHVSLAWNEHGLTYGLMSGRHAAKDSIDYQCTDGLVRGPVLHRIVQTSSCGQGLECIHDCR